MIEGLIRFGTHIPVLAECLNRQYTIIIAGKEGVLRTPSLHQDFLTNPSHAAGKNNLVPPTNLPRYTNIDWVLFVNGLPVTQELVLAPLLLKNLKWKKLIKLEVKFSTQ